MMAPQFWRAWQTRIYRWSTETWYSPVPPRGIGHLTRYAALFIGRRFSGPRPSPVNLTALAPLARYVAFLDILGWGHRVALDYREALTLYDELITWFTPKHWEFPELTLKVYSDSLLLVSPRLAEIVAASRFLQMVVLGSDCLLRGGVGFGAHIESNQGGNLFVISQGLVQAVEIEKTVKYPCIALHQSLVPPRKSGWWRRWRSNLERPLLYFDGICLINPFSPAWFMSAATRVAQMDSSNPAHAAKYEWFLRLYDAVQSSTPLIPPT